MKPALLQIQNDITSRLSIELLDWGVTVLSQRAMIVSKQVDEAQLYMTLKNGMTGAGVLVQMPTFASEHANAPGPIGVIQIACTVKEFPETNMNASTGTTRSAEEIAMRVMQLLHLWRLQNIGTFYAAPEAIRKSLAEPGIVSYDVVIRLQMGNDVLAQTGNPTISGTSSAVTITNGSGYTSATLYYTTDGESYPGPDQDNSLIYSAPFAVASGSVVRAAAYLDGYAGSDVVESTIT